MDNETVKFALIAIILSFLLVLAIAAVIMTVLKVVVHHAAKKTKPVKRSPSYDELQPKAYKASLTTDAIKALFAIGDKDAI